jgi:hypothetical protein
MIENPVSLIELKRKKNKKLAAMNYSLIEEDTLSLFRRRFFGDDSVTSVSQISVCISCSSTDVVGTL